MNDMDRYSDEYDIYRRYPDLYRRVYPKVNENIERHIREKGEDWEPSDRELEDMIEDIYEGIRKECPEIEEDLDEKRYRMSDVDATQRPYYGRRRLTRDFISIVLLGSLLGRRRRRRRPFPRYGFGPGYWY